MYDCWAFSIAGPFQRCQFESFLIIGIQHIRDIFASALYKFVLLTYLQVY